MNVLGTQFLMLWRTRRVHALIAGLVGIFGLLAWSCLAMMDMYRKAPPEFALDPALLLVVARMTLNIMSGAGAVWAVIVWRSEPPSRRNYQWSLPVAMARHDRARVVAGAVWLMVLCIAICLAGFVTQHTVLTRFRIELPAIFWPSIFTVTLIPYLLASGVAVVSDHAAEWLLIVVLGFTSVCVAGLQYPDSALWIADRFFLGPLGPGRALGGGWADGARHASDDLLTQFNLGDQRLWLLATMVWFGIGLISVIAASQRAGQAAA